MLNLQASIHLRANNLSMKTYPTKNKDQLHSFHQHFQKSTPRTKTRCHTIWTRAICQRSTRWSGSYQTTCKKSQATEGTPINSMTIRTISIRSLPLRNVFKSTRVTRTKVQEMGNRGAALQFLLMVVLNLSFQMARGTLVGCIWSRTPKYLSLTRELRPPRGQSQRRSNQRHNKIWKGRKVTWRLVSLICLSARSRCGNWGVIRPRKTTLPNLERAYRRHRKSYPWWNPQGPLRRCLGTNLVKLSHHRKKLL